MSDDVSKSFGKEQKNDDELDTITELNIVEDFLSVPSAASVDAEALSVPKQ